MTSHELATILLLVIKNKPSKPTKEKLAYVGTLTSGLVHELRNPMNAIKANLQLLEEDMQREEDGDGPHTRRVNRVLKEVERLDKILSNFLVFVKSNEFNKKPTNLSEFLQEVVSLISPQADEQGVTILADLGEDITASIDRDAMKVSLMNLTINGLQAMESEESSNTATLIVRLSNVEIEGECFARIEITDTGKGIPQEKQKDIFELFYTDKEKGSGIGLAVVSRIVEGHGGKITCSSEPGKGTSFLLDLPTES